MNKTVSRKFFGISILILLVLVSLYLFLHSSFFNIEKITITGLKVVPRIKFFAYPVSDGHKTYLK